ncbi:MAG: hypothetical protein M3N19_12590 [Candidatus Eremiobacteraeota bacterium]|nr:hypothetical protein [Candidatus Eremiobacteraeota bacterium]
MRAGLTILDADYSLKLPTTGFFEVCRFEHWRKGDDLSDSGYVVDAANRFTGDGECEPYTSIPAWWSGFLFHVLNPRQVSMYLYLSMLSEERGICNPTIDNIRRDLGLASATMVFEAIGVLEDLGFFLKERVSIPHARAKRNVYQRASCEYTILRLLQTQRLDGELQTSLQKGNGTTEEVLAGIRGLVGDDVYAMYVKSEASKKKDVLINALQARLTKQST